MSPPRGGDSWKWSDTENQSKPLASANFHSFRISASGPPMCPMWIPNFMSRSRGMVGFSLRPCRVPRGHSHGRLSGSLPDVPVDGGARPGEYAARGRVYRWRVRSTSGRGGGDRPMDCEVRYSEEQQGFRAEVRAWLTEHVAPDITRPPTSPEDNYRRYQQLRALGRELGAKGWLFPRAPETH